jgi:hypothetical protein
MMPEQLESLPRKTSNRTTVRIRTKTDTGRQGEYPKALERTVLKELGNLTPYVRNKGSLPSTIFLRNSAISHLAFIEFCIVVDIARAGKNGAGRAQ